MYFRFFPYSRGCSRNPSVTRIRSGCRRSYYSPRNQKQIRKTNQVQETKTNTPSGSGNNVVAPVNGVVVKIVANPGDSVSADQTIVILESMKMEIEVKAGSNGKLSSVNITKGQNVEEGQPIFTLE